MSQVPSIGHDVVGAILARLAAGYQQVEPEPIIQSRNVTRDKASRSGSVAPAFPSQSERETHQQNATKAITGVALPKPGALGAKGFLIAMRDARSRDEKILAIAAYCGFDNRGDYGAQELAATSRAKRELKPIAVKPGEAPYSRNGGRVDGVGYVAGKPDSIQALIGNLEARERLAAETLGAHRRDFLDVKRTMDQRRESQVLMDLEEQRIAQIRADLRLLGVDRPVFANEEE